MDNKIFNVNGRSIEMLRKALELAFFQSGDNTTAKSWAFIPDKGFVLFWYKEPKDNAFPAAMSASDIAPLAYRWLESDEAKSMVCTGWDKDSDHDGHNTKGWRVYVEDWGHVADRSSAICAIRPVYLWHGK